MSLAALASTLLAICKAVPAAMQFVELFEAQLADHRRTQAHAQIDADRKRITAQPWVCPRTCPHRGLHEPEQPAPPAGHA